MKHWGSFEFDRRLWNEEKGNERGKVVEKETDLRKKERADNSKASWRYLPSGEVSARTEERTADPLDLATYSEVDPVEQGEGDRLRESPTRKGKGIRPKPTISREGTDCIYKESPVDHRTADPDSPFEAVTVQTGPSHNHTCKNGPSKEVGLSKHTTTTPPHTPMYSPIKPVTPSTPLAPPNISIVTQPIEASHHSELGSTIHTAPPIPIHPFGSPKHQTTLKEREWKVYVRSKGCKQKQAQKTKKHILLEDPNPLPYHQHTSGASTPPSDMRCQLSATHSPNQSMRNTPAPSPTAERPNEELIKEASSQWELAKLMGRTKNLCDFSIIRLWRGNNVVAVYACVADEIQWLLARVHSTSSKSRGSDSGEEVDGGRCTCHKGCSRRQRWWPWNQGG
ncbi:hypothetical protein glysoja_006561 [Glycine soja]|nr:hypothetical protein glysoja_006561 [Glycine soja]